ncbi:hypothetical protein RDABS01_000755, partial [Bienertia sinuspersici]
VVPSPVLPAIVFGDFNEILYSDEKDGGATRDDRQMANFRHVVDSLALRDLGFRGSPYTWPGERALILLFVKDWTDTWPLKDHGPILLKEEDIHRGTRSKMRRFESLWLSNENCEKVVKEKWNEDECMEAPARIAQTLEKLSEWARELIDYNKGCWDSEKISQIFNGEDRSKVLNIPLSHSWPEDRLYWWPRTDGVYTIRSGYWLGKLGATSNWANAASDMEKKCWKMVWNIEGPPKLKHFLWRACSGILAVMERLYSRYVVATKSCPVCGELSETISHALFQCKLATEIWKNSGFVGLIENAQEYPFMELVVWVSRKLQTAEFIIFLSLVWAVWSCRNKAVFEGGVIDAVNIAQGVVGYVEGWLDYNIKTVSPKGLITPCITNNRWLPPMEGWIKINVDAHIGENEFIGVGAVWRNHMGKSLGAAVRRCQGKWRSDIAEAMAALFGVQVARRLGFGKVILEAHLIAREFVEVGSERVWLDPIPQNFCTLADLDLI